MTGTVPPASALTGIGMKVLSVAIFVAMQIMIKAAGDVPAGEIVFFRSLFAIPPILLFLMHRNELRTALATSRPLSHVARGLVGVSAMALSFFALTRLPLPEAITLNYSQPLLVVIFSALFLHETIRVYRWSAVVVGLVGVLIISWPKLTLLTAPSGFGNAELLGVIAALVAATFSAVAAILVRNLVHTEKTATIVLWFSLTSTAASLVSLPFGWQWLTPMQYIFLIGAGISGGVAQILMTQAYRYAEASLVAPFEYTSIILGVAAGYWIFSELPTLHTLGGGAIVVAAGIFIIWREHRLGLPRGAARKLVPPQG